MTAGGKYQDRTGPRKPRLTARGGYARYSVTAYCYRCARMGRDNDHRWDEYCLTRDREDRDA